MHVCVHSKARHDSQDGGHLNAPDGGTGEEDAVHTHSGLLLSHSQEGTDATCSHVGGPRDHHSE